MTDEGMTIHLNGSVERGSGQKFDVLIEFIEDEMPEDMFGLFRYMAESKSQHRAAKCWVWADAGMREVIGAVEGVVRVTSREDARYKVTIDPRYDAQFVAAEIEAAVKCYDPKSLKIGVHPGKEFTVRAQYSYSSLMVDEAMNAIFGRRAKPDDEEGEDE